MSSSKSKRRGGGATPSASPHHQQACPPASPSSSSPAPSICTAALHGLVSPDAPTCICTVSDVDSKDGGSSATLWMSEASMISASISASQLVTVSVVVTGVHNTLQLESLERLFSRHFGIILEDHLKDEPGTFCAIAAAWPCRKLPKERVRLSKQLANTLGCPPMGTYILVSPMDAHLGLKHARLSKDSSMGSKELMLQECQHLGLRWCPLEMGASFGLGLTSPAAFADTAKSELLLPEFSGDSLSSPVAVQPSSQTGDPQTPCDFFSASSKQATASPDVRDSKRQLFQKASQPRGDGCQMFASQAALSALLEKGSDRARGVLEKFASYMLGGRILLKGNFVTIPICGQTCIFQVIGAQSFSQAGPSLSNGRSVIASADNKSDKKQAGASSIFLTGSKTLVNLLPPVVPFAGLLDNATKAHLDVGVTCDKGEGKVAENIAPALERFEYSAIGGLSEQITTLKEIIELSLLHPERLMRLGLQPPRGVLLYGPPGTGKTSLALACALEAGVRIFSVNGPEIISEFYGESEAALREVFTAAQKAAPSVVFIDELDAIAPQRKEGSEELGQRMVAALLTLMDGGGQDLHHVLVIAATNRVEAIDPALRRPGRFDREIEIGVPSPSGRREILHTLLHRMSHTLTTADLETLAAATHGFVGADLAALCNEAAMVALRRYVQQKASIPEPLTRLAGSQLGFKNQEAVSSGLSEVTQLLEGLDLTSATCLAATINQGQCEMIDQVSLKVSMEDFEEAKARVRPSAMREVMLEVPKVHWSDIGGQEEVKHQLQEAIEWPQKHGDAFTRIGAHPPTGVLLYGPPGCSKTLMARAVATEAGLNFIAVKGPELFSKWVGESEKAVHALFERARAAAPSVVFFDELDGLAVTRDSSHEGVSVGDRVMSQLLVEMDGLNSRKGVTVIAATNRPDKIDAALLRPGRFDRLLYVGPPNEAARLQIFEIHTRKMPCGVDVDERDLAACTNGYTGADIAAICREAAMAALEEDLDAQQVMMHHFKFALSTVQPSRFGTSESFYAQFCRGIQNVR